jgi:hypothetical protein
VFLKRINERWSRLYLDGERAFEQQFEYCSFMITTHIQVDEFELSGWAIGISSLFGDIYTHPY